MDASRATAGADFENTTSRWSAGRCWPGGSVFFNMTSSNTKPRMDKIEQECPKTRRAPDAIYWIPCCFARVKTLYDRRAGLGLESESLRLLERYHRQFIRAGAALSERTRRSCAR